ncbi:MAG TPA: hypothetical protein PKJ04_15765, partial [Nitrospira sp.]|nr:hypothetical protein [Nitrospira sp.]
MVGQSGPLLALIDDSYVEALMVPFRDSLTGRLTTRSTPGHASLFVRHVELGVEQLPHIRRLCGAAISPP